MSCFQPSLNDLAVEGTLKTNKQTCFQECRGAYAAQQ